MPFKDKAAEKEAARLRQKALRDRRKGVTDTPQNVTPDAPKVTPSVTPNVPLLAGGVGAGMGEPRPPAIADVESGKAWVVLTGPYKGELRWHGPLAQSWKNVPCQVVDGVCVAPHYDGRHVVPQPHDDGAIERARARLR